MSKYQVVGETETVEVLGVLRSPNDVLSLRPEDAEPEVARGVLVEMAEEPVTEVPVAEAPAGGDDLDTTPVVEEATPADVGGGVVETLTDPVEATQPTGDPALAEAPEEALAEADAVQS